jgi:hypothetical protein
MLLKNKKYEILDILCWPKTEQIILMQAQAKVNLQKRK